MFDKEFTLNRLTEVIKRDIIPHLTNDYSKEQAIAMISVLKNVNLNTVQNYLPFQLVNELLFGELNNQLSKMAEDVAVIGCDLTEKVKKLQFQLQLIDSETEIKTKWEKLNELFSGLITMAYQNEAELSEYIQHFRTVIRKQIDIEMELVS
jgi:hypothetical protein